MIVEKALGIKYSVLILNTRYLNLILCTFYFLKSGFMSKLYMMKP